MYLSYFLTNFQVIIILTFREDRFTHAHEGRILGLVLQFVQPVLWDQSRQIMARLRARAARLQFSQAQLSAQSPSLYQQVRVC